MVRRIIALDVGERRIGVAVSDPLGLTAQGVETIHSNGWSNDLRRVGELLSAYETDRIVVGLPRSLSGEIGPQAQRIRDFADRLTENGWQVMFQDERLTTVQADRVLIQGDVKRRDRKSVVDKLAATLILQAFLDAGGWPEPRRRVTDTATWKEVKSMSNKEDQSMEFDNVIELVDEEGQTVRFEIIMSVPYGGEDYVLLAPVEPTEDMDEDEVLVLRITNDDNGEEIYVSVDDDDLVQKVFEKYLQMVEEEDE